MKNIILASIIGMCSLFANTLNAQWIKTNGPQGGTVTCIAKVHNNIWAGTRHGIYVSGNEGATWSEMAFMNNKSILNLYCSGDTIVMIYDSLYVDIQANSTGTKSITSFDAGITWSPAILIDAFYTPYNLGRMQDALYVNNEKISRDFGLTWTDLALPLGVDYLQWYTFNNKMAIAAVLNNFSNNISLFRSLDAMQTWQFIDSSQLYYNGAFISDSVILLSKGTDVLRSVDNGTSFQSVFTLQGQYPHPYFSEKNGTFYMMLSDTAIQYFRSNDSGLTWQPATSGFYNLEQPIPVSNGDILSVYNSTVVRNMAGSAVQVPCSTGIATNTIFALYSNKSVLFAGTANNLYRSADGGLSWYTSPQSLRLITAMTFFGDTVFAAGQDSIFRSYNNGLSWEGVTEGFAMDESTLAQSGDTLFAGREGMDVAYTADFGNTWHNMPALSTTLTNADDGNITVLNNTLYAVANGGYIFKYNSVSNTWIFLHEFWSPGAHNHNKLYTLDTVLAMAGRDEFLISHDYGNNWVQSPLTGLPFGVVYPRNITLYNGIWLASCGTYGVYKSIDEGISWQPLDAVPTPFAALNGFAVVNDILYAGTAWNSVWRRAAPFSSISGQVYLDANNNGIKDTAEQPMRNALVYTRTMGHTATTDTAGNYTLVTDAIGDTMRVALPNPYFTSAPQYYITTGADTAKDFGLHVSPSIVDISVELTNTNVFRPGFNTNLLIEARNNGHNMQTPVVALVLDSNVQYTSATPSPTNTNGDTLLWQTGALNLGENVLITVNATTYGTATLGGTVTSYAFITPILGDTIPENNVSELKEVVVGSYDPNDKQCSMGNKIMPQQIQEEEEVVFTVRFQNTGNYQADFVRIADTISPFFDLSTFKVLSSSHTMHWSMQGQGIVNFYFDSILLPAMADDEPGSHGFVKYSVKCKQSAQIGDAITNTAYIYFDFNAPIITNTTTTVVTAPFTTTSIHNEIFVKDLYIKVYPNPSSHKLNIDLSALGNSDKQIAIYSIEGQLMVSLSTNELLSTVSTDKLPAGMYFGIINSGSTIGKFKFITAR